MKKRDANDDSPKTKKIKIAQLECKICGAPAFHSNYGAVTCHPCKMFFKRHVAIEQKLLTCSLTNQCEININNRHICPACRLAKCFDNGMQPELIRGPISKKKIDNQTTATNQSLTTDQKTLLTNLIDSYDETRIVSIINQLNETKEDFLAKIYDLTGDFICSNEDFCLLSSDDRSNFLRNLAENITCINIVLCWYQAKHVAQYHLFKNIFLKYYDEHLVSKFERLIQLFDADIILRKLVISLFAFSVNSTIFSSNTNIKSVDTSAVSRIQNIYIEILWNYLTGTYGYSQSIQRFDNITKCLSLATDIITELQNNTRHVNDMNFLVEKIELKLIVDDLECNEETK